MRSETHVALLILDLLIRVAAMGVWIVGIVLAKGFWSTFFAVVFPLWSYIVVAMHYIQ